MADIAIIAPRYHTNMICFIKALKDLKNEVTLLVQYVGKSEDHSLIKPRKLMPSGLYMFLNSILSFFNKRSIHSKSQLRSYIPSYNDLKKKLGEKDIVFVKGLASPSTLLYLHLARRSAKKVIFLWQTDSKKMKRPLMRFFSWLILNVFKADLILTPNDPDFRKLGKNFGYLPFCIDIKDFKKNRSKIKKIISVGKFVERKDQKLLVKAFSKIENKNTKLTLVGEIADKKYYDKIKTMIQNKKLNVELITNIKHKELLEMYKDYDLFILPSYSEPASYSQFEAMAAKLPIILSDECGTKECVREGKNGFIFKARDVDSLKVKIREALSSDMIKMGEESFNIIKEEYSLKKQKELLKNFL